MDEPRPFRQGSATAFESHHLLNSGLRFFSDLGILLDLFGTFFADFLESPVDLHADKFIDFFATDFANRHGEILRGLAVLFHTQVFAYHAKAGAGAQHDPTLKGDYVESFSPRFSSHQDHLHPWSGQFG